MTGKGLVIVVGTGPAGAAAALLLAQHHDVLLLEAGSARGERGLVARVRGLTFARVRRPLNMRADAVMSDPQAHIWEELAPGGLSNHWSCAVPRFADEDFADAARAGEAYTWPIGYADIAPYYDRIEPRLHIAGSSRGQAQLPAGKVQHGRELAKSWLPLAAEAERGGRTLAPMPYAYGSATTATLSGNVFNAFDRLIKPELRAGRLKIRYDAAVARLVWSSRSRKVEAVVLRNTRGGAEETIPCRAVVLAAGAINTAQILLESSSADFPQGLGNEHGLVGRYLHDHPLGKLIIDLAEAVPVNPPVYLTRPVLDRAPPLYAAACMQWSGAGSLVKSVLQGRPGRLSWIGFSVFGTMAPSSDDGIRLDPERRTARGKGLTVELRHPGAALTALEQARDDLLKILGNAGWQPRVRSFKVEGPGDSVHYGGTCRMHASERYGVVDRWSRLFAARNVVVADSSVFTTGPEKNPVLTSMALATRAADRLGTELKEGEL